MHTEADKMYRTFHMHTDRQTKCTVKLVCMHACSCRSASRAYLADKVIANALTRPYIQLQNVPQLLDGGRVGQYIHVLLTCRCTSMTVVCISALSMHKYDGGVYQCTLDGMN